MCKYIIIGQTGGIGSYLSNKIFEADAQSLIVLQSSPRSTFTYLKELKSILYELENVKTRVIVVNCIGVASVQGAQIDLAGSNYANVQFVEELAKAISGFSFIQFIHLSTCLVYGINNGDVFDERSDLNPVSLYSRQKLKAELSLFNTKWSGSCSILRLSNVYGRSIAYGTILYEAIKAKSEGVCFAPKNPNVRIDFLYEDDLFSAILLLARNHFDYECEVFNVCSETVVLASEIENYLDFWRDSPSPLLGTEIASETRLLFSAKKLKSYTGWRPSFKYLSGLSNFYEFRNNV